MCQGIIGIYSSTQDEVFFGYGSHCDLIDDLNDSGDINIIEEELFSFEIDLTESNCISFDTVVPSSIEENISEKVEQTKFFDDINGIRRFYCVFGIDISLFDIFIPKVINSVKTLYCNKDGELIEPDIAETLFRTLINMPEKLNDNWKPNTKLNLTLITFDEDNNPVGTLIPEDTSASDASKLNFPHDNTKWAIYGDAGQDKRLIVMEPKSGGFVDHETSDAIWLNSDDFEFSLLDSDGGHKILVIERKS
jgi:hypothetical protein